MSSGFTPSGHQTSSLHSLHSEGSSYLITNTSQALRSMCCHEGCVSEIGLSQVL